MSRPKNSTPMHSTISTTSVSTTVCGTMSPKPTVAMVDSALQAGRMVGDGVEGGQRVRGGGRASCGTCGPCSPSGSPCCACRSALRPAAPPRAPQASPVVACDVEPPAVDVLHLLCRQGSGKQWQRLGRLAGGGGRQRKRCGAGARRVLRGPRFICRVHSLSPPIVPHLRYSRAHLWSGSRGHRRRTPVQTGRKS